ncbi:MAG TPA: hypothetical protein VHV51_18065 [Polyangiaceae bacterium]|jgi:hypothetical protein|nr:hypothetical protein [Polyangiaceae bacterium]
MRSSSRSWLLVSFASVVLAVAAGFGLRSRARLPSEPAASTRAPAGESRERVEERRVEAELPAPSAPAAMPSAPTPPTESALMDELRRFKDADPEFAIERAREENARFPNSADAPERTSILIHALAAEGRASEARGEAEDMVNRYPDSEWVREVERFTGAHRHRNVHVDADGKLAYD